MGTAVRPRCGGVLAFVLVACVAGSACVASNEALRGERDHEPSLPAAHDSTLGRVLALERDGLGSEFVALDRPDDALDARLALVSLAESSIDVQSYLWHEDGSGSLLLDRLLEAADRGVRVRLLIDDFKVEGRERLDRALQLHPNLEIRVFNPTLHHSGVWKALEIAEHLESLDHRMHNKLLVVDGVAAVFGGRNVGDEYFGMGQEYDFRDFDLLSWGPVVADLADSFDGSWNSPWSLSLTEPRGDVHEEARETLRDLHANDPRLDRRRAVTRDAWVAALERARSHAFRAAAQVVHDDSDLDVWGGTGVLARAFEGAMADSRGDVLLVTAYLVPDEPFLENVRRHVAAGGSVRILTNSYGSTNQPAAHAYYAAARVRLLEAGAELHELRGDAWGHVHHRSPGSRTRKLGLHAKVAVFGEDTVLVGSMNLDPRSMRLNTELGVLIESRELAARIRACVEREFAGRNAWRVWRHDDGGLRWTTLGLELREEPLMPPQEHAREWFLELLPLRGEV